MNPVHAFPFSWISNFSMLFIEEGHSTYTVGTANLVICFFPSASCDRPYENVRKINILQTFYVIYRHENHSSVLCKVWNTTNVNEPKWNSITHTLITSDESEKALRLMKKG
jgi:hypothetical protein